MINRIFGVAISIENTLLKYFIKRVLLDFLTLWPCCTGLLGLWAAWLWLVCLLVLDLCTHTDTHNISHDTCNTYFWAILRQNPPTTLNWHNRFSKLACGIWFLYHPDIHFFLIFDFEGGKPSTVSVMNHCFLKPIRFSLNLHSWNWRENLWKPHL